METLAYILLATLAVSAISFVGLLFTSRIIQRMMRHMISFAVGALFATAFFNLLPEAVGKIGVDAASLWILVGIVLFYILDRFVFWYHCHKKKCKVHAFTYVSLIGDGVHNFVDGMIISASFMVDVALGMATTIAVIVHEIPQEISDFSILIYGGLKKKKALLFNFLTALTAVAGALFAYYFALTVATFSGFFVGLAAGGFIYIAGSDLIPEMHKEEKTRASITQLITLLFGIAAMWALSNFLRV